MMFAGHIPTEFLKMPRAKPPTHQPPMIWHHISMRHIQNKFPHGETFHHTASTTNCINFHTKTFFFCVASTLQNRPRTSSFSCYIEGKKPTSTPKRILCAHVHSKNKNMRFFFCVMVVCIRFINVKQVCLKVSTTVQHL